MVKTPSKKHLKLNALSQFSETLHKILCSEKGYALLSGLQCGWLDGACWSLAASLKLWMKEVEIWCVFDGEGAPQHVVVKIPGRDIFIDGNGLSTRVTLKKTMEEEDGIHAPNLAPFKGEFSVATPNGIELNKDIAREVCRFLGAKFGEGTYFLWTLCEAEEDLPK